MTSPRFARLAARGLARSDEGAPAPPSAQAREAAIGAIARALEAKSSRRRRMRTWYAAGAAAATLALGLVGWRSYAVVESAPPSALVTPAAPAVAAPVAASPRGPFIVVHPSGDGVRVVGGTPLPAGGEALAPGARVSASRRAGALLAFSTGTAVMLDGGGELSVVEQGPSQVLALVSGALRADVARLAAGERFVVKTADAEVEVHGTSFRVASVPSEPGCGDGARTRVQVYEGVVVVRHGAEEARLVAGDAWPRGCGAAPVASRPAPSPARVASGPEMNAPASGGPVAAAVRTATPPEPALSAEAASALARQNDLFASAVAARRRGDSASAIGRFDALLSEFPASPLAESASVEKLRLLRETDRGSAVAAAREYLSRYPSGFARAEAEAIVLGPP